VKLEILRLLADNIKKSDPYREAEVKARGLLRTLQEHGKISSWEVKSDPNSTIVAIWWTEPHNPGLKKIKIDLKVIDRDLLTIMEVLES